jgi:hypothetical protein
MRTSVAALAFALAVVVAAHPAPGMAAPAGGRRVTLFYTGAVHGTLEPCGCTSDPLGDIARLAALVRQADRERAGAVLLLDGGNLSFPPGELPARKAETAELRARFLADELGKLHLGGSAIGEADLVRGPDEVVPKRLAANAPGAPFAEPSRLHTVGGVRIGVFGVAPPNVLRAAGARPSDPVEAARAEAATLRSRGAEVIVALTTMDRPAARQLARQPGIDLVVLGAGVPDGLPRAEKVEGGGYLVAAAEELQRIGRIELVLRGGAPAGLVDAGGPNAAKLRKAELERTMATLDAQLARWKEPQGDGGAFVARKRRERDALAAELAGLKLDAWTPPATGSYFTNELIALRRTLPRDAALAAAMHRLDAAVGAVNLKLAEPPPAAEPGRARFVGDAACAKCHKPALAFWRKTVHAHAWKTLVDGGKQNDLECVGCHVTGYGEVGGSSLGHTKGLESVQCETCHGPGSLHVAEEGLDEPTTLRASIGDGVCLRCHTEKHSDTFDFTAYLRDVLGPGHGPNARAKLGPGITGHELRSAALARAKTAGAAQAKVLQGAR